MLAVSLRHLITGQEEDPSDDLEDLDDASDDVRYLLRKKKTNLANKLTKQLDNRSIFDAYDHDDIFGAEGGIELFCRDDNKKSNKVKQIKRAVTRAVMKKVGVTNNKDLKKKLKNQDQDNIYFHIPTGPCHIFIPKIW